MINTAFSAGAQFLGYLYQARYSLYLTLQGRDEIKISLETLDDVVFHEDGTPRELLQLKHHTNNLGNLTDTSPDLWKTIRIWSTYLAENRVQLPGTQLFIVTNAIAPESSIASKLSIGGKNRDDKKICQQLSQAALKSKSKSLKDSFDAFMGLNEEQKELLVSSVYVLDRSPSISDLPQKNKQLLLGVHKVHLDAIYERLEGWWFDLVVKSLQLSSASKYISRTELLEKIASINDEYKPGNLPIEFLNAFPPDPPDPQGDQRTFVLQLREIILTSPRIEKAIIDYYRAFQERSKWVRENLIESDEIQQYEATLIDEWERYCFRLLEKTNLDKNNDQECIKFGKAVYDWVEGEADIPIRDHVRAWHVMRGSYHILADQRPPLVWWHPKFVEKLEYLLSTPANE